MDDAWLERVVDQEEADGRFATPEAKAANHKGRVFFADMHRKDLQDDNHWMAKQVYLNVGNFLLGVAAMGLDAVPVEGFDAAILDAEFDLTAQGFTSLVLSYRSATTAWKISTPRCRNRAAAGNDHHRDLIFPRTPLAGVPDSFGIAANHRQRNGQDQEEHHLVHPVPEKLEETRIEIDSQEGQAKTAQHSVIRFQTDINTDARRDAE
jgi:hypothetical protein